MDIVEVEYARVLKAAEVALQAPPRGLVSCLCSRSPGGVRDYYSEGDYWWPDAEHSGGPYQRRDGLTNPDAFTGHRQLLIRLSIHVAALAAAYKITRDEKYASHAIDHLRVWFLDEATRMEPNLQFAQAIPGRCTGRGIGIIDTVHLIEVAKAVGVFRESSSLSLRDRQGLDSWFGEYLNWITTHPYGISERDQKNNHATCWLIQAAVFAQLMYEKKILRDCFRIFTETILPQQMAGDGSFPKEIERTKPYAYSIYNLDILSGICQVLASPQVNLWAFELPDGRGMRRAMAFLYPYLFDKTTWPYPPDVMHDDAWPVRQPCLLFAGLELNQSKYLELWETLDSDPANEEVVRNFPIRQPVLWV